MVAFDGRDPQNTSVGNPVTTSERLTHESDLAVRSVPDVMTRPGYSHVGWGAVIAGSVSAISLLFLSSLLAYACGVPAFQGREYGWGAGIWSVISAAIAFFVGGFVAAQLSKPGYPYSDARFSALRGMLTWALAVPLILLLSVTAAGAFRGFISADVMRMTIQPPLGQINWDLQTGAAWGTFLSLAVGLICATVGGMSLVANKVFTNRTLTETQR